MTASMVLDGPMTGEWFLAYVEQVLVPTLRPDDVVILDNLPADKGLAAHHVSILTMNGDSYCLKQSAERRRAAARADQNQATPEIVDPDTGEITTS
jgi:hypothetical protein